MSGPPEHGVRVLVVDDQSSFREAVAELVGVTDGVSLAGVAADVRGAVAQVRERRSDLVLVDINLGDESGIDLTREILAIDASLAVILMSTYAVDDLPEDVATCGARSYLHKASLTPASLAGLASGAFIGLDP